MGLPLRPFGPWVGPFRSSQVCSALQRLRRFGLPPSAALLQPLSRGQFLCFGGLSIKKGPKSKLWTF
ncbi:hypothetical protein SGRA_2740 [Saprospira grandis str. Lewin]|uniref:Uncharacterized protein n=1 Tax=Saprospira grandis (strain Lewin) TaxID=984262 RepID=H6L9J2_SAPGL|nr:hypothetical protein SGRA_2740 [Saprospira grandis str. Lewin]